MQHPSDDGNIGSPMKRARASVSGVEDEATRQRLGLGLSADIMGRIEQDTTVKKEPNEDEEL